MCDEEDKCLLAVAIVTSRPFIPHEEEQVGRASVNPEY